MQSLLAIFLERTPKFNCPNAPDVIELLVTLFNGLGQFSSVGYSVTDVGVFPRTFLIHDNVYTDPS